MLRHYNMVDDKNSIYRHIHVTCTSSEVAWISLTAHIGRVIESIAKQNSFNLAYPKWICMRARARLYVYVCVCGTNPMLITCYYTWKHLCIIFLYNYINSSLARQNKNTQTMGAIKYTIQVRHSLHASYRKWNYQQRRRFPSNPISISITSWTGFLTMCEEELGVFLLLLVAKRSLLPHTHTHIVDRHARRHKLAHTNECQWARVWQINDTAPRLASLFLMRFI